MDGRAARGSGVAGVVARTDDTPPVEKLTSYACPICEASVEQWAALCSRCATLYDAANKSLTGHRHLKITHPFSALGWSLANLGLSAVAELVGKPKVTVLRWAARRRAPKQARAVLDEAAREVRNRLEYAKMAEAVFGVLHAATDSEDYDMMGVIDTLDKVVHRTVFVSAVVNGTVRASLPALKRTLRDMRRLERVLKWSSAESAATAACDVLEQAIADREAKG